MNGREKRACHRIDLYERNRKRERESFYDNVIFVTRVVSMNELFS